MTGQRLPDESDWHGGVPNGSYWKRGGTWWAVTPNGHLGNLAAHDVVEHEDGTITVRPSILVGWPGRELYHGYLERGIWRSC